VLIKRIVLLVMIFTLSASASALAAEPGSGIIEGQIVNGTEGSSGVADQELTLKTYLNDAEVSAATTKTDAEGRFVFDGLSTEPGHSYQIELTFQEAEYPGEWLSFEEGETTKSTEFIVYDSTTSDTAIKLGIVHTIIYVGQGSLRIEEWHQFSNESLYTYIGSAVAEGARQTLQFSLPNEATGVELSYGLMECCVVGSGEGFADSMPVFPGEKWVVYSYAVDYSSGAYTLSQKMNYPTVSYEFLVQGTDVSVSSDQLTAGEPAELDGILFNHFSGQALAADEVVVARLSGLPQAENQLAIWWVVLALIVLGGGFGLVYRRRRDKLQPVAPEDSLDQKRQRLLIELAKLDDDFADGKIPEETYHRLRAESKTQLVALTQGDKEASGSN
jgi:hypothetical protein